MADLAGMKRVFLLGRIVALLALAGLAIAPMGETIAAPAMAAQAMAAMAGDMPCCPDEETSKPDCIQDCPFLALCVAGLGNLVIPESARVNFGPLIGVAFAAGEEIALASLSGDPPSRPPRI
jgi:hypothetical protein